jgi:Recombination endonuclease VII
VSTKIRASADSVRRARHALAQRQYALRRKYGIDLADYAAILEAQGGVCAGCGKRPKPNRVLHVDHSHVTDEVRGLLHVTCNVDLAVYEDASIAKWAPGYLADPPARAVLKARSAISNDK